jgi:RNA polymerase sigma-70 factor (ECF subfamily)
MMNDKNHINGGDFVSLITSHQRRIFAYIITLVPNRSDAEDIMQETSTLMWEKKNDFTPGSDFVAWGARIAYYKILDYRKKVNKNRRMVIKEGQFKRIEERALENSKHMDDMINKLDECMKKASTSFEMY